MRVGEPRFEGREKPQEKKKDAASEVERVPIPENRNPENIVLESGPSKESQKEKGVVATVLDSFAGFIRRNRTAYYSTIAIVNAVSLGSVAYSGYERFANAEKDLTIEEEEAALDGMHDSAASELRQNFAFSKKYTPEQVDAVARGVEGFSSERFFSVIAEESGMSAEEVAHAFDSHEVFIYADETIDQYLERAFGDEQNVQMNRDDRANLIAWADSSHAAGLNNRGSVFLNISTLVQGAGENPEILQSQTFDVLLHEHMHSFTSEKVAYVGENDPGTMLYEGTTELLSNVVRERMDSSSDVFGGYSGGETAAAAVLYEGLSSEERKHLWRGYLTGDTQEIASAYASAYGEGAYERVINGGDLYVGPNAISQSHVLGFEDGQIEQIADDYRSLVLLENALSVAAPSADDFAIVDRANAWLENGKIVPIRGKDFSGVDIVGVDGGQRGFIRLEGDRGTRILSLVSTEKQDGFSPVPDTNMGILWTDLGKYHTKDTSFDALSFDERGGAVVKMLKAHRGDIEILKEL